jgi:hypothetical protein
MSNCLTPLVRKLEREAPLSEQEKQAILDLCTSIREMGADHDVVREGDKRSKERPKGGCLSISLSLSSGRLEFKLRNATHYLRRQAAAAN